MSFVVELAVVLIHLTTVLLLRSVHVLVVNLFGLISVADTLSCLM